MNGAPSTRKLPVNIVRYALALSDSASGIFLLWLALFAITGVHMGITPIGLGIGLPALALASASLASAHALWRDRVWRIYIRHSLYALLFLASVALLAYTRSVSLEGNLHEPAVAGFAAANLVAYELWLRGKRNSPSTRGES